LSGSSETGVIVRHAGTVLAGQMAIVSFSVADTLIAGQYSQASLAALSIGSSIYISIYVALNGMMQALLPVWAQLRGAEQFTELGRSVRQALYLCTAAIALGVLALIFPDPWLEWTQVPEILRDDVRRYLLVLAWALAPSLLFRMYSTFNQSLGMPRLVTWLQIGALGVKIPLSMALTFGVFGLPAQGAVGCAVATLIVNCLMLSMGLYLLRTQEVYRIYKLWRPMERLDLGTLAKFLRQGVPAGLSIMVEITSFTLMALFIARMGVTASAGHQIAATAAGVLYMIPLALGIASSARVGFWLGANQPDQVRRAMANGLVLSAATAVVCSAALWLGKELIAKAFTRDADVALIAIGLLSWVAIYHFFDAIQTVCAFLLRCFRITLIPLLIYSIILWGIGLGGGYLWAYDGMASWLALRHPSSFWIASCAALGVVTLLFLGLTYKAAKNRAAWPIDTPIKS
jgi:MATE family multidrug resistance protein